MQASDENDRGMDSAMSRVRIRPALNGLGVNRHRRGYTVTNQGGTPTLSALLNQFFDSAGPFFVRSRSVSGLSRDDPGVVITTEVLTRRLLRREEGVMA